jgi:hypothetical protein
MQNLYEDSGFEENHTPFLASYLAKDRFVSAQLLSFTAFDYFHSVHCQQDALTLANAV